ncbi:class II aaRS and biotin synthetase [Ceraceosorus guamensis]|uniref:threonine--tRNA ligase n=1 Tax=Ceraceosorus guamensis TaxID=1522189 RepID=A0A316W8L2_9BASI|nr:class II aaRS and biotin synthetase [Ceraceosorus guamensis]PWN46250.1 class II aaRS and biotin synthetase [Ceraceosorus guamensis]
MNAAAEADHRAIGSAQELFIIHDASPGTPFVLPNGTRLIRKVERVIRDLYALWGYDEIITPQLMRKSLWQRSGHWDNYRADMFGVQGFVDVDMVEREGAAHTSAPNTSATLVEDRACCAAHDQPKAASTLSDAQHFGLKPMNCPGHCLVFASKERSYRDLPIRYAEFSPLHRNESSGSLSGLTRVRRFHQDDAHVFCSLAQVSEEITSMLAMLSSAYRTFGFEGKFELVLSTRPASFIGSIEEWDRAEAALEEALNASGQKWSLNEADGAFYGPKIDVRLVDASGRRHQTATIQLDFQLPRRFELKYTDPNALDGSGQSTPVMIHRAILGSVERFLAILIEQGKGHWPFWINPRQGMVLPVKPDDSAQLAHAELVKKEMALGHAHAQEDKNMGVGLDRPLPPRSIQVFHVDLDATNARYPKRVAKARAARFNFVLTVGDREVRNKTVNVTAYGPGVTATATGKVPGGEASDAERLQDILDSLQAGKRPNISNDLGEWNTKNLRKLFEALDSYHC